MRRPITLFTGQWADLPLETLAKKAKEWGFDGLELACWGDHFQVDQALESDGYLRAKHDLLDSLGLRCLAISNHLVGQCTCDPIDSRHQAILPGRIWGDGDPEGVRQRAAEEMKATARAARLFGVDVVNGFTGSSVWGKFYFFPPTPQTHIDTGYQEFAKRWLPILSVFKEQQVKFALEVHPTEIAYDIITAQRTLKAIHYHPSFGFNFDPSHFIHQFINPIFFIEDFKDRLFHVHVKDARVQMDGRTSILASHLDFGDHRRGWDFVSPGRGGVEWDQIIRALNRINYQGPLSIEWEDSGMDREWGAPEALAMVRQQDFAPSSLAFDTPFANENDS